MCYSLGLGYGSRLRRTLRRGLENREEARIAVSFPVGVPVKVKCDLDVRRRARYVLLDVLHRHVGVRDAALRVKRVLVILKAVLQGAHGLKVLHDGMQETVRGDVVDAIDFGIDDMFVSTRRRPELERRLRLVWCE